MKKNKKINPKLKWGISIGLIVVALLALFYPTSYYVEMPGTTEPLGKMVKVEGKKDEHKGDFFPDDCPNCTSKSCYNDLQPF